MYNEQRASTCFKWKGLNVLMDGDISLNGMKIERIADEIIRATEKKNIIVLQHRTWQQYFTSIRDRAQYVGV